MAGIFISYRQADAKAWAISLRNDLVKFFGKEHVFLDKESLQAGNWRDQIQAALVRCNVVLVVIGPRWLSIMNEQNQLRINLNDDVHHQEIALALKHHKRQELIVIPVLVDDATMPKAEFLAPDIRSLCEQQAYKIGDTQARHKADLDVLVKDIQKITRFTVISINKIADDEISLAKNNSAFKLDFFTLGIVLALVLLFSMISYLTNSPLSDSEIFVLFLLLYALSLFFKWMASAYRKKRGNK